MKANLTIFPCGPTRKVSASCFSLTLSPGLPIVHQFSATAFDHLKRLQTEIQIFGGDSF
jgi:hypothetical protein